MLTWNGRKIVMLPSKEIGSDKKTAQLVTKPVFIVTPTEGEFMIEIKMTEELYVMVVVFRI